MSGMDYTLRQLLDLYHQSRKRGEWASLSLETRECKDFMTFSFNQAPAGAPARSPGRWQPSPGVIKKWKSPSQLRRDQMRKQDFLAKKRASLDNVENLEAKKNVEKQEENVHQNIPVDKIELTEIESDTNF